MKRRYRLLLSASPARSYMTAILPSISGYSVRDVWTSSFLSNLPSTRRHQHREALTEVLHAHIQLVEGVGSVSTEFFRRCVLCAHRHFLTRLIFAESVVAYLHVTLLDSRQQRLVILRIKQNGWPRIARKGRVDVLVFLFMPGSLPLSFRAKGPLSFRAKRRNLSIIQPPPTSLAHRLH